MTYCTVDHRGKSVCLTHAHPQISQTMPQFPVFERDTGTLIGAYPDEETAVLLTDILNRVGEQKARRLLLGLEWVIEQKRMLGVPLQLRFEPNKGV